MNGMDAVIQIRNGAVKGFWIYADKSWGCAERLPLRASPDAFHSTLKIRKEKLCLSIKAFYAVQIFSRLRGGARIAQRVAKVARIEQSEIRDGNRGLPRISFHSIRATLAVSPTTIQRNAVLCGITDIYQRTTQTFFCETPHSRSRIRYPSVSVVAERVPAVAVTGAHSETLVVPETFTRA